MKRETAERGWEKRGREGSEKGSEREGEMGRGHQKISENRGSYYRMNA